MQNRVLIIAEVGVNHNRDVKLAFEMIAAAAEAGADIIKCGSSESSSIFVRR